MIDQDDHDWTPASSQMQLTPTESAAPGMEHLEHTDAAQGGGGQEPAAADPDTVETGEAGSQSGSEAHDADGEREAPAVLGDEVDDNQDDAGPRQIAPGIPDAPGLAERIADVRARVARNRSSIRGEETVKNGLVLPFLVAMGYDVFDPSEVTPAYAPENGQRVDYAVRDGDDVRMLMSVTSNPADLGSERARRLSDALAATGTRCAILTDGTVYRFHSDVDARGVMDDQPLFVLDLSPDSSGYPAVLSTLCRDTFDPVTLIELGSQERRVGAVRHAVGDELADPSEAFVELIRRRLGNAGIDADAALHAMINSVTLPLSRRMDEVASAPAASEGAGTPAVGDDRVMTREETDAYNIVRALCARHIDPNRVIARPAKSYCAILLDDNNRRSIARLHFNSQSIKHLGTFVGREETRNQISGPNGIYELEALLTERLRELDPQAFDA